MELRGTGRRPLYAVALVVCIGLAGCSDTKDQEQPPPPSSGARPPAGQAAIQQDQAEPPTAQREPLSAEGMTNISDNPRFFTAAEITPASDPTGDLDSVIRPVLIELFGGAKLTAETPGNAANTSREDLLHSMTYVVRRLLDVPAGDELHAALCAVRFSPSPRYGSSPQHGRNKVLMSFFKITAKRRYSLGISLDLVEQTIHIESFALDSEYDRP
jgi:hypothetical protein